MRFTPIAIVGPTASGKTPLALAIAARLPVEIISIDSAQVYVGMDIGTAKPSAVERAQVPHHLLDIIAPTEPYSAARFRTDAQRAICEVQARGRLPLLVGGTMLYLKALRDGLSDLPGADPVLREEIEREAQTRGWPALHADLARLDPPTAARLDPNDAQRIQRALEVIRLTGQPMSALLTRHGGADREHAVNPHANLHAGSNAELPTELPTDASAEPPVDSLKVIALMPAVRADLHRRIAERFDAMLAAGLVEELEQLKSRYSLRSDLPSMRCVGYRQAWQYLEGAIDRATLRETAIAATRQLAKRQMTWIRAMTDVTMLECFAGDLVARAIRIIETGTASRGRSP